MLREELLSFLYPRRCPVCGDVLLPWQKGRLHIHPTCYARLYRISSPFCYKCGKGLRDPRKELCPDCSRHRYSFECGRGLWRYDSASASAIYALKYRRQPEHADFFALCLARFYGSWLKSLRLDYIVPVPVSPARLRDRGYNQAELIAVKLGELLGIPVCADGLWRVRSTDPQKELGRAERLHNLEKAFQAREERISGRRIVLLDDVYTTGATAESCCRALKKAGAGPVWVLTACTGIQ